MIITFRDKVAKLAPWKTVETIVLAIAAAQYEGNVRPDQTWCKGSRVRFTLRNRNSDKRGARLSASGRHGCGVSWEAHRDVMRAIYAIDPAARIMTGHATYTSAANFEATYLATGDRNVGSQMEPARMRDLSIY